MGAALSLDLYNATQTVYSLPSTAAAADGPIAISSGGVISSLSGVMVGDIVDLVNCNNACQVYVAGRSLGSGPLMIGVQTSDATTSGSFTDPTSGLAAMPSVFQSGGYLVIGSGGWTGATDPGGIYSSGLSGSMVLSGFMAFAGFQRPHRYARLFLGSGFMDWAACQAGFVSQLKTQGSGAGFAWSPQSSGNNTINV